MRLSSFLKNKETKNAGWLIGGRVVQMVLSLLVGVLTARYLGPGNYGLIGYASSYVAFFTSLCTLGLNSVIIKDFVDNPEEEGKAIGSAIVMRIASSVLSAAMIVSFVAIVDRDEPLTIAVVALSSLGLIFHVFETFNFWFQSRYKSKITTIATLLAYIITSAYKLVLLYFGKSVRWFAFATSVDYIVVAAILYIAYKNYRGPKLEFSLTKCKALLNKSYHYILSGMMVAIYGQTDKLMLKQMLDEASVGYYNTASTICKMWVFVLVAIIDSIYPTILSLHKENEEAYKRKNKQLYAIVFYVSVTVSLIMCAIGGFVVKILYGDAYTPAIMPLKIITWYTAFSYLGVARNAWIVCEGKQKYLKYMYLSAAVINVILNFSLIPVWGASGAAFASLVTQIFTSIVLPLLIPALRPNAKLMLSAIFLRFG